VLLPTLVGCGEAPDPEPPPLTGEWIGEVVDFGDTATVTLDLTEGEDGSLTGTLAWVERGIPGSGTARGRYTHPDVVLNLELVRGDDVARIAYTARRVTYARLEGILRTEEGALAALTLEQRGGRSADRRTRAPRAATRVRARAVSQPRSSFFAILTLRLRYLASRRAILAA